MYIQKVFEENRISVLHDLIEQNPLGTLTVYGSYGLSADHLPFTLDRHGLELGVLKTHIARGNPLHKSVAETNEVMVIFQGPDAYISPSWLPRRHINGRVQPSWAYTAVHAMCSIKFIDDDSWIKAHFEQSVNCFEAGLPDPWQVAEAPKDFIDGLKQHVVGIELTIHNLLGKRQLMQQRNVDDRLAIIEGLRTQSDPSAHQVAKQIAQTIEN
ncbi:FMN-binding negative transcriptional regulator [Photorhabdus viridis]|uniref:FMN-binding negative transcriptional regulator n=1 Tax=Photorhabdus viridis TaxID=3163327 RepID=UPI0033072376